MWGLVILVAFIGIFAAVVYPLVKELAESIVKPPRRQGRTRDEEDDAR
jgi:uncharacterized membrane protein YagU involved in acid resistance